jgi:cytoskeletal protein RodZ
MQWPLTSQLKGVNSKNCFQNARDKKRMKMEEMESAIKLLEEQNRRLLKTNEKLEAENRVLVTNCLLQFLKWLRCQKIAQSRADPTIASHNTRDVKIYSATNSMARF